MPRKPPAPALAPALLAAALLTAFAGEAQAQITLFPESPIQVLLTGAGQTPPVATTAVGECSGRVVPATGVLDLTCSSDVAAAGEVIVTLGPPGAGGVEVFDLGSGAVVGESLVLGAHEVADLLTGRLFVAATSAAHPDGEIVGRLLPRAPVGEQLMRFPLRNDSLVATGSDADADCALRVSANQATIALVCAHDVANATSLRVLVDGGVVATVNGVASPFQATLPALAADYQRFLDGDYGVVLASQSFPQGELGMVLDLCIAGPETLCLTDDRFRVSVQFTQPGHGAALARTVPARADDSGLFWFFGPNNWEVLVKVLAGCPVNGQFWVFLSANTSVKFDATVYDTLTGRTKVYSNPQGKIAEPRADTSAFPCS